MAHPYKTAEEVHKTAQDYLDYEQIYRFINFYNAIKDDARLVGGITPDMVGQAAKKYLDDGSIAGFTRVYAAIKDDARLVEGITPDMVGQPAKKYLNKGWVGDFTRFYNIIEDDARLVEGITPDMIGQAAQELLDKGKISALSRLFKVMQDNQTLMQAALPGHDIFYIPAGEKTHEYDMTLAFNRQNGQFKFFAGCLPKDSLLQLKEHCEQHDDDQRREQALPTVVRVFRQIAAGESPTHATTVIVDDVDRVARAAERELKAAEYSVPRAA